MMGNSLILFYNVSGAMMCILSVLMFAIRKHRGEDITGFNVAKYYLATVFLLAGLSMFVAQFDQGLSKDNFEILNPLMLLFFFLISQGFLWSFFLLYAFRYPFRRIFNRFLLPVFFLFGGYAVAYFSVGDRPVYSIEEFLSRLPYEPMLMLRCVILVVMAITTLYSIRLCHLAKTEYHRLIRGYFSETDFSRSIWLSNLLASAEALAGWIFLTYFYTTPVLEVIIGTFVIILFAFYVKEFYEYQKRYDYFRQVLFPINEKDVKREGEERIEERLEEIKEEKVEEIKEEKKIKGEIDSKSEEDDRRCAILLSDWKIRTDKPFTKQGLTIGDVSKDLNIPRYLLSGYVNRNENNFCSWINDLRIDEASKLLCEEPTFSISDIAERTGFCDLPAFSRAFKKIHHVSPREYRNRVLYGQDAAKTR